MNKKSKTNTQDINGLNTKNNNGDNRMKLSAGEIADANKATIVELEAEIRNLQRQVDAANDTFIEMKHNKTVVFKEITEMEVELNKRYELQGLLGDLGYI